MSDPLLVDLATQVREISDSQEHQNRRLLWKSLHRLSPPRALVSYGMYAHVWERNIASPEAIRHCGGVERSIEVQLRSRLWKARAIADDEPVLPTVWLTAPHPSDADRLWGVPLESLRTAEHGAYKPLPPIKEPSDISRLRAPTYEEEPTRKNLLKNQARELLGDVLPVRFHTDELHFGPFEWAVRLRGMDNLLLDVYDRPEFVRELMSFITDGMIGYHCARQAAGAVDPEQSWGFHMYYDDVPPGGEGKLSGSWAYIHAQSAASLSPDMYGDFIQPYNEKLASLFWKIYYHGCEDLSAKCHCIRKLPNLTLFHVGPWTPLELCCDAWGLLRLWKSTRTPPMSCTTGPAMISSLIFCDCTGSLTGRQGYSNSAT